MVLATHRLFLALVNLTAIDYHVVFMRDAIDADRTKGERLEAHADLRRYYTYLCQGQKEHTWMVQRYQRSDTRRP